MLHSLLNPIKLPDYESLRSLEGKGNYALSKYYKFPYRRFYRHKLRMVVDLMDKETYRNIMDFGSGPGIFSEELKRHCINLKSVDINDKISPKWKFDLIVCASVLEFVNLDSILPLLNMVLKPQGSIIVASPMETRLSKLYFKLIGDKEVRYSHKEILSKLSRHFRIEAYKEWMGLYFSIKARKR